MISVDNLRTSTPQGIVRTGKFFDDVTGLYYNQARWYDPTLGRFISESPIAPFAEEEYAYCGNDPVNFVDVNGLALQDYFNITNDINSHYNDIARADPSYLIRPKDKTPGQALEELKNRATTNYGGQVCASAVDGFGANFGFTPFAGTYDLRDPLTWYSYTGGYFAPWVLAAAGPVLRPFTLNPQTIVHWGPSDVNVAQVGLRAKDWVMTGSNSIRNYIFSGVWTRHYPMSNYIVDVVSSASLRYPISEEGLFRGIWKGLMGQRIYNPF